MSGPEKMPPRTLEEITRDIESTESSINHNYQVIGYNMCLKKEAQLGIDEKQEIVSKAEKRISEVFLYIKDSLMEMEDLRREREQITKENR